MAISSSHVDGDDDGQVRPIICVAWIGATCRMAKISEGHPKYESKSRFVAIIHATYVFTTIKIWNKLTHKRTPSSIESHTHHIHTAHTRNTFVYSVNMRCMWTLSVCMRVCHLNGEFRDAIIMAPQKKRIACFQCSQINFDRNTYFIDAEEARSILHFIPIYCNLISPLFVFIVNVCGYSESHHIFSWFARHMFRDVPWWPFMSIGKCRKGRERIDGARQDIIARKCP